MNPLSKAKGWTPHDGIPEPSKENDAKARELASLYRQTFETEAGARVLDLLVDATLLRPIVYPQSTQFEAGIREGKADLVRQILAQIEYAKGG